MYFLPFKILTAKTASRLRRFAGVTFTGFSSSYLLAHSPDPESYAWECFRDRNPGLKNTFWSWIALVSIAAMWQFQKTEAYFNYFVCLLELYITDRYLVTFNPNRTSEGEQRVYFRGDNRKDAESVLKTNRGVIFTHPAAPAFTLPFVSDTTLMTIPGFYAKKNVGAPPGTTGSVVSITSKLDITHIFGDAALIFVPDKVASTAPHCTKERWSAEREHFVFGIHRKAVLGVAYFDPDTYRVRDFKLNPDFSGDIEKLDLDEQMRAPLNFLPDGDMKTRLLSRIKKGLDYSDEFVKACVDTPAEHAEITHKKLERRYDARMAFFKLFYPPVSSLEEISDDHPVVV